MLWLIRTWLKLIFFNSVVIQISDVSQKTFAWLNLITLYDSNTIWQHFSRKQTKPWANKISTVDLVGSGPVLPLRTCRFMLKASLFILIQWNGFVFFRFSGCTGFIICENKIALDVIIARLSDIDLSTQLCVMRCCASVGDPCLMPGHGKVEATTWVIFQEPLLAFRCPQPPHLPPQGRICPWIFSSLQCWTSMDEQSNYMVWITPRFGAWIDSKVTVCWETSADYCEMFLSVSVSQPHSDCFCHWGESPRAWMLFWDEQKVVNTDCKCQDYYVENSSNSSRFKKADGLFCIDALTNTSLWWDRF